MAVTERPDYPWFQLVEGDELEQGDIIIDCPVFQPPPDLPAALKAGETVEGDIEWKTANVILLSQTCDLVKGREKLHDVLLCPVFRPADMKSGHLTTDKGLEDARRGNLPAYHMLNGDDDLLGDQVHLVDFRTVYSLPLAVVRTLALNRGRRPRLLPPYREQLSQGFARFFMRVGLPVDIPAFRE